jgi:hypothetical protein
MCLLEMCLMSSSKLVDLHSRERINLMMNIYSPSSKNVQRWCLTLTGELTDAKITILAFPVNQALLEVSTHPNSRFFEISIFAIFWQKLGRVDLDYERNGESSQTRFGQLPTSTITPQNPEYYNAYSPDTRNDVYEPRVVRRVTETLQN